MAKRQSEQSLQDISGFIHGISPVKMSKTNTKYFDASIQSGRNEYHRLVCFDIDKRCTLEGAEKAKRGLKFSNVRLVPSTFRSSETDVLLNSRSTIAAHDQVDYAYKQRGPDVEVSIEGIKDIQDFNKITLKAKVIKAITEVEETPVRGKMLKKQDYKIADHSGQIKLSLWEDQIGKVEEGHSYSLTNLSIRSFNSIKSLSATQQTTFSDCNEIKDVNEQDAIESTCSSARKLTGEVTHIVVSKSVTCNNCKKKLAQENTKEVFLRCQSCNMKQKTKNLAQTLQATMTVKDEQNNCTKLIAFDSLLSMFIMDKTLTREPEDIEDFFLENEKMTFEFTADKVIKSITVCQ